MERKPITILPKYLDRIEFLPEDCRDAMISAIVYYGAEGRFPTFDKFDERDKQFLAATFSGIKGFLDESIRKREAGASGTGESKARFGNQNAAKNATETQQKHNYNKENKLNKENKEGKYLLADNEFYGTFLSLGVTPENVQRFKEVRERKGSSNTNTVLNSIVEEIKKAEANGATADECISMAGWCNWQAFNYDWYLRKTLPIEERRTIRDDEKEMMYMDTAVGSDLISHISKRISKSEDDTYHLLDVFDSTCNFEGVGHNDFDHFVNHFEKAVREGKVSTKIS